MQREYNAALYMRLSKDDDGSGESASISNQRRLLTSFCRERNFCIFSEYIDDGYSGVSFNRPAFNRMISDIETGCVNLVITKDLSRLGREYIQCGHYQEVYFPLKGVRFIALNDGYDSDSALGCDIAPFKNVMNEFYARDTSRKIRSAFRALMEEGAYVSNYAPYGYRKMKNDRHRLEPEPETAKTVKLIFLLAAKGKRPKEISNYLTDKKIENPSSFRKRAKNSASTVSFIWSDSTVRKILKNEVYLGHTVQGKTVKPTLKSKTLIYNRRENMTIVKNTHEPLVSQRTFNKVRKNTAARLCRQTKKSELLM